MPAANAVSSVKVTEFSLRHSLGNTLAGIPAGLPELSAVSSTAETVRVCSALRFNRPENVRVIENVPPGIREDLADVKLVWCGILQFSTFKLDRWHSPFLIEELGARYQLVAYKFTVPDSGGIAIGAEVARSAKQSDSIALNLDDKITDRDVAQKIGLLAQPLYLDARTLNLPEDQFFYTRSLGLEPIMQVMLDRYGNTPTLVSFGDFGVRNQALSFMFAIENKMVRVLVSNDILTPVARRYGLHEPMDFDAATKAWRSMSSDLSSDSSLVLRLQRAPEDLEKTMKGRLDILSNGLLATDRTVYVKSGWGAGGKGVIRVSPEHAADSNPPILVAIEADSEGFPEAVTSFIRAPDIITTSSEAPRGQLALRELLTKHLQSCNSPIVEEEISAIIVRGHRAEHRFILSVETHNEGAECHVVADFMKWSPGTVTGNVFNRGSGRECREVLRDYAEDTFGASEHHARNIGYFEYDMRLLVERFACEFANEKTRLGYPKMDPCFAIDVLYVPDDSSGYALPLKPYFLEVQSQFGFSVLKQIDPIAYSLVNELRDRKS